VLFRVLPWAFRSSRRRSNALLSGGPRRCPPSRDPEPAPPAKRAAKPHSWTCRRQKTCSR
jgi:hypothetical protein